MRSLTGRCVVFDLDDTLYDEMDYVRSGFDAAAEAVQNRYGTDCRALLAERWIAGRLEGAFQDVVRASGLPDVAVNQMLETYRDHVPALRLREGVFEGLQELKRRDGVVGCITDGRSLSQRNKLKALGLDTLLDPVLVSEETGHGKPDPHNFREMMRLVEAGRFWYVADNPAKDFIAPNALGWTTVGVRAGRGVHRASPESLPATHRPAHQLTLVDTFALLARGGG